MSVHSCPDPWYIPDLIAAASVERLFEAYLDGPEAAAHRATAAATAPSLPVRPQRPIQVRHALRGSEPRNDDTRPMSAGSSVWWGPSARRSSRRPHRAPSDPDAAAGCETVSICSAGVLGTAGGGWQSSAGQFQA